MLNPTPEKVKEIMRSKGYVVFGDSKYDLNIFGIRTADMSSNKFNDIVGVMYLIDNRWVCFLFPATTDPGTYWREHPMNVAGTAILRPGQYRGSHQLGLHQGKYQALVQKGPLTVYRDADHDNVLETDESTIQTGMFGINIHRASIDHASTQVDKWSAGCQVLQDPIHFNFLIDLANASSNIYGNSFTYTLLEESDFE